jgi:hypothetical protein
MSESVLGETDEALIYAPAWEVLKVTREAAAKRAP